MLILYVISDEDPCAKERKDDIKLSNIKKQAFCFSQPELPRVTGISSLTNIKLQNRSGLSFSQPASVEDLLVSSQLQALHTQASQV